MGKSELAVFAWRNSADLHDHQYWIRWCCEWGKAWSFQKEEGDSGYIHYQGVISLKVRRTVASIKNLIQESEWELPNYFEPVADATIKSGSEAFYVTKPETRIEGPWSDKNDTPIYIPRHVRDISLYPWQKAIADSGKEYDSRRIDLVIDKKGNLGKSTLCAYLRTHKLGRGIPFMNDYKDLLRMVMDMPKAPLYIVDMPRAISKDRLFQLWSAIETVKSGYAFDDRYHFREEDFDRPRIWVFTNSEPDLTMLSSDMWRFWEVTPLRTLQEITL